MRAIINSNGVCRIALLKRLIQFLVLLSATAAQALTFNITYDASVTGSTNSTQIQAAFGAATQIIQNLYTNSSTVNITVYWGPSGPFVGGVGLGVSSTSFFGPFAYSTLTNALRSQSNTSSDSSALASLPASDPIAANAWRIPRAEIKALGLASSIGTTANDTTQDGAIGFATNVNYTFDPTNRAVAGKYDFISVALHEISEVMGRVYFDLSTRYVPYDLFRFTNNGARCFDPNATNVYFSVDNGATSLRAFYTNQSLGDIQDWKSSGALDSFDAFISSGKKGALSYADLLSLDVIGYKLSYLPPQLSGTKSIGSSYTLTFTNTPGTTYTVLATTNLALASTNWITLGTCTDSVPGNFQFTDTQAGTNKLRFYQLRLN